MADSWHLLSDNGMWKARLRTTVHCTWQRMKIIRIWRKIFFKKRCVCYLFWVQRLLLSRSPYPYSYAKIPLLKLGNKSIHSIQSNAIRMFDVSRTMQRSIIFSSWKFIQLSLFINLENHLLFWNDSAKKPEPVHLSATKAIVCWSLIKGESNVIGNIYIKYIYTNFIWL